MDWDNLYSNLKKFANRTADKINRTADIATLQVKLSMADKKLEEAYAALGHVSYDHFTGDDDLSEKISRAVSGVNNAIIERKKIEAELNEARRIAAEAKAAEEAERAAKAEQAAKSEQAANIKDSAHPVMTDLSDTEDAVDVMIEEE